MFEDVFEDGMWSILNDEVNIKENKLEKTLELPRAKERSKRLYANWFVLARACQKIPRDKIIINKVLISQRTKSK